MTENQSIKNPKVRANREKRLALYLEKLEENEKH